MKIIALDIETTGLDPRKCDILEVAAVYWDTEENPNPTFETLPAFHTLVLPGKGFRDTGEIGQYGGDPYALRMNRDILSDILTAWGARQKDEPLAYMLCRPHEVPAKMTAWLNLLTEKGEEQKFVLAGKNAARFDVPFLAANCGEMWSIVEKRFAHRIIDVGSMKIDFTRDKPPSLEELLVSLGLRADQTHRALGDAIDVLRVINELK